MKEIIEAAALAIGGCVILVLVLAVPSLLTMWAINTLCGPVIPYTFWNWLAVLWLGIALGVFKPGRSKVQQCKP